MTKNIQVVKYSGRVIASYLNESFSIQISFFFLVMVKHIVAPKAYIMFILGNFDILEKKTREYMKLPNYAKISSFGPENPHTHPPYL